jgi:uncharacterized SAM-dependent methyltransferase
LPAWLLYDERGSALFEEITLLPEYYLTRTERAILAAHAGEMIDAAGTPLSVAELGAGTASKTQLLLAALLARQPRATYMPIDVSLTALAIATAELARFRRLTVDPRVARRVVAWCSFSDPMWVTTTLRPRARCWAGCGDASAQATPV